MMLRRRFIILGLVLATVLFVVLYAAF